MSADTVIDCNTYLGANLYLYCYGDPVNYVDHSGNIAMQRKLNDEGLYPTSVALQYQHWQKYNRRYFESYLTGSMDCMWVETASSLNLAPDIYQFQSGFDQFRSKVIDTAYKKQYHTSGEYWVASILFSSNLVGGGYTALSLVIPEFGIISAGFGLFSWVVSHTADGLFSIDLEGKNVVELSIEDREIENLREDIIPLLNEISDSYKEAPHLYGNYANIYLNYQGNWAQLKIEVTDWVGALPAGALGKRIYIKNIEPANFFVLAGLLQISTYVYYRDISYGHLY